MLFNSKFKFSKDKSKELIDWEYLACEEVKAMRCGKN